MTSGATKAARPKNGPTSAAAYFPSIVRPGVDKKFLQPALTNFGS